MPSNGWVQIIGPRDNVPGIHTLNRRADGTVTVWHRYGKGYRLTKIDPDGSVKQVTAWTKQAARAAIR